MQFEGILKPGAEVGPAMVVAGMSTKVHLHDVVAMQFPFVQGMQSRYGADATSLHIGRMWVLPGFPVGQVWKPSMPMPHQEYREVVHQVNLFGWVDPCRGMFAVTFKRAVAAEVSSILTAQPGACH
ncbi:MAG: hypothetical protein RL026_572 [Pseudomonadota bacterium]